jgi:uncharacterized protein
MLRTYLKYTQPWQQFLAFIGITLGVSTVILLITTPLLMSAFDISSDAMLDLAKGKTSHPNLKSFLIASQTISVFCLFIIPAYIYSYFADEQPTQHLGLHQFPKWSIAIFIIPLVLLSIPASNIIGVVNQMLPLPQSLIESENAANKAIEKLVISNNITDLIVSLIVVALFAAISEELFFRSILQRIMIQWSGNAWAGIIITAILFSAFHMQFSGFFVRFGLGVLLGALYWYSGSIYAAIAFHFLHNAAGVLIVYFNKGMDVNKAQTTSSMLAMSIVGIAAIAAIVYIIMVIKKRSSTRYEAVYSPAPSFFD